MGHARYIGRVGALAVALGVGAAIATSPGVASATPGTGDHSDTAGQKQNTSEPVDVKEQPAPPTQQSPTDFDEPRDEGQHDPSGQETPQGSAPVTVEASGGSSTTVGPTRSRGGKRPSPKKIKPHQLATNPSPVNVRTTTAPGPQDTQQSAPLSNSPKSSSTVTPNVASLASGFGKTENRTDAVTLTTATAPATPATAVVSTVQKVANAFAGLLTPSPDNPGAPALMFAVLAFARREFDSATRRTDTATPLASTTTGQLEGTGARTMLMSAANSDPASALPPGASVDLANAGATTTAAPDGVVLSNNGSRAYVTNKTAGTVTVIDTATGNTIGSPIALPAGAQPTEIISNTDGSRLYVANRGTNNVSVIDTTAATPAVVKTIAVGTNPEHLAISPDGARLWVSNAGSGTLTKINTANYAITTPSIKVGANPGGIAFSPNGDYAYVANQGSGTVSVINTSNNTVKTLTGAVGANPTDIAVNTDTGVGYVATLNGTVTTFDTTTNTVTGTIATGKNASTLALSPDRRILVTANTDETITAIDTGNRAILDTLQTDLSPTTNTPAIAFSPSGTTVFITDTSSNALRKVTVNIVIAPNTAPEAGDHIVGAPDSATGTVHGTVVATDAEHDTLTYALVGQPVGATVDLDPTTGDFSYTPTLVKRLQAANASNPTGTFFVTVSDGRDSVTTPVTVPVSAVELANSTTTGTGNPSGVVLNPTGTRAYVTNTNANTVTVIDTATGNTIGNPIPVGAQPTGIAVNADGSRVYVANRGSNSVSVINTTTPTPSVVKTISVGTSPEHLAITPDGTRLLVSNNGSGTITRINTANNTITTTIKVGKNPGGIAFSSDGKYAYVANQGSDTVSVITMSVNTVKNLTGVGDGPTSVAVNPATGRAYVTTLDGKVTLLDTATNSVTGHITTGKNATAATLSPDGAILVIANTDDTITAIDTTSNTVLDTLQIDPSPEPGTPSVAYHPGGQAIYVTDGPDNVLRKVVFHPANRAPIANATEPFTITATNLDTGVVTGKVNVSDPDNDVITYAGSTTTSKGTVAVDAATGGFTYMPSDDARTAAVAGGSAAHYTFSVTATDAHGATLAVPVTVTVVPTANPTNGTVHIDDLNPSTGVVTGTVTATDPRLDGGVTYELADGHEPTHGTVEVNPDGTFTYTPDDDDRADAIITPTTDGFGVTATDGHGTTTTITVSTVPVTPAPTETISSTSATSRPQWMVFSADGTKAYVTDVGTNAVWVIDTQTNQRLDDIPLTGAPVFIARSPDDGTLWVSNSGTGMVSVIDPTTKTITHTVAVGAEPIGITFGPNHVAYVANRATGNPSGGSISVIDTATYQVIQTIPSASPVLPVLTPDRSELWFGNQYDKKVTVLDTTDYHVITEISMGNGNPYPTQIAFNPTGSRAYITNQFDNVVRVVDTSNYSVIDEIPMAPGITPAAITINSDGSRAYVTNFGGLNENDIRPSTVAVIDLSTDTVIGQINVGGGPIGATLTSDGKHLWIVNTDGTISIIPIAPPSTTTV